MPPLIRAVRPYASRRAFLEDAARLVLEGGPVHGVQPLYGRDNAIQVLRWPQDLHACADEGDGPQCKADCKGQSIRAARAAYDTGHRVELVITTRGNPAHMVVRIDGKQVDPSEAAGMLPHVPASAFEGALIVGVESHAGRSRT